MARRLEDVLQKRRETKELGVCLVQFQDEVQSLMRLVQVLENACTSTDIPEEFKVNADLAGLIWWKLQDLKGELGGVERNLRQTL